MLGALAFACVLLCLLGMRVLILGASRGWIRSLRINKEDSVVQGRLCCITARATWGASLDRACLRHPGHTRIAMKICDVVFMCLLAYFGVD